ncbi:MAG: hypothetical protein MPJ08_08945 [Nitrosopumilus sp.]|nr:hypothetical protein [Nitrosopumilus sp.]
MNNGQVLDIRATGIRDGGIVDKCLIVLLGSAKSPVSETRIQNAMFLFSADEQNARIHFDFFAGTGGPHSSLLQSRCGELCKLGTLDAVPYGGQTCYMLSAAGRGTYDELAGNTDAGLQDRIARTLAFLDNMTDEEMCAYMCRAHPGASKNSSSYGGIMPKSDDLIIGLVKKSALAPAEAARLLDTTRYAVMHRVEDR